MTNHQEKPKRDNQKKKKDTPSTSRRDVILSLSIIIALAGLVAYISLRTSEPEEVTFTQSTPEFVATATMIARNDRERAFVAVDTGMYLQAAEYYTRALENANDPQDVLMERAYAYSRIGDYAAALADYNHVLESDAENLAAWLGKTNMLYRLYERAEDSAKLSEALRSAAQTVQLVNDSSAPLSVADMLLLGDIFYASEEYGLARMQYKAYAAVRANPNERVSERLGFLRSLK